MLTVSEKLQILNKTSYDYKDVMKLVGCGRSKAFEIMKVCRNSFNGQVGIFTNSIKPTSLFQALGMSLEEEIKKTKLLGSDYEKELYERNI